MLPRRIPWPVSLVPGLISGITSHYPTELTGELGFGLGNYK